MKTFLLSSLLVLSLSLFAQDENKQKGYKIRCLSGDCINGQGKAWIDLWVSRDNYWSENWLMYEGSFLHGEPKGKGKGTSGEGYSKSYQKVVIEGNFNNLTCQGTATYTYSNGEITTYKGRTEAGLKNGMGVLYTSNGEAKPTINPKYRHLPAKWVFGGSCYCLITFKDGSSYTGGALEDFPDGEGSFAFSNGTKATGTIKHQAGVGMGSGTIRYVNGDSYEGQWMYTISKGKPALSKTGNGKMYYKNGDVYNGEWSVDKKNGFGVMNYAVGNRYEGKWAWGEPNPDTERAQKNFDDGIEKIKLKDFKGAISAFNVAISRNPNYTEAYLYRGITYLYLQDHEQSMQNYNKAIALNPAYYEAYYYRYQLKTAQQDYAGALDDINKAMESDPQNMDMLLGRANLFYALKKLVEAEKDIASIKSQIAPSIPNTDPVYYLSAQINMLQGKGNAALGDLNQAIKINPKADYYIFRGSIYEGLGRADEALEDYKVGAQKSGNKDHLFKVAAWAHKQGKKEDACQFLRLAIKAGSQEAIPKMREFCGR